MVQPSLPLVRAILAAQRNSAPRRPHLTACPRGHICAAPGCHSLAAVTDGDDAYCASCALDRFDVTDLPCTIDTLGECLDDFARGIARAQELAEYEADSARRAG